MYIPETYNLELSGWKNPENYHTYSKTVTDEKKFMDAVT